MIRSRTAFALGVAAVFGFLCWLLLARQPPEPLHGEPPSRAEPASDAVDRGEGMTATRVARLRVVDGETGEALTGASLSWRELAADGGAAAKGERAGIQGECRVEVGGRTAQLLVNAWADGTAKSVCRVQVADAVAAPCDVRVWRAQELAVHVVDGERSAAVAGAAVTATLQGALDAPRRETVLQLPQSSATAADGRARLRLAAASYEVRALADGFASATETVEVRSGRTNALTLVLARRPALLRGVVVEAWSARPLAGAVVEAIEDRWRCTTGADGTFERLHADDFRPASGSATLLVSPPPARTDLAATKVQALWGQRDLRIALGSRRLCLYVAGAPDAGPVELAWSAMAALPGAATWHPIPADADGTFVLPGGADEFRSRWMRLAVGSGFVQLRMLHELPYRDTETARRYRWAVTPERELVVTVADGRGQPIADAQVEIVFTPWNSEHARDGDAVGGHDDDVLHPFTNRVVLVAAAHTDTTGVARVAVRWTTSLWVRCRREGCRTEVVRLADVGTVRVRLMRCGGVAGTVVGYENGELRLVREDDAAAARVAMPGARVSIAKDGAFVATGFDLGVHRVYLVARESWHELGLLTVADPPGPAVRLVVPAIVWQRVRIRSDGLGAGDELQLRHEASGMQLAAAMDRAGGATALVPPGRYAAWRARRGPGGTVCVRADRDVDVVAGDDNDFALAFAGATGRVRLLTEDGPLCGAIVLPVPNCFVLPGFVTDADGWLAFDELPSARCELEHRAFDPTTSVEVVRRWIVTAADLGREVRAQE